MRRFSVSAFVLASCLVASNATAGEFAQRGKILLEGAVAFTSLSGELSAEFDGEEESVDLPDQSRFLIGGTVGGFVTDGFFLGGTLTVDYQSVSFEGDGDDFESSSTLLGLAVAPRYYISLSEARNLFLKLGGHLGYNDLSTEDDDSEDSTDSSASGFGLGAEIGLVVAFGETAGAVLDISLFAAKLWLSGDEADDSDIEVTRDTTTIGLSVGIGAFF